ncbi:hypothetical protein HORIV_12620 [Vreelandella olivaria]|uniref:Uncharacterized protein n=1 Tax=Vreelandella olivaria TaxID=390919 RepID=A0ABN5WWE9_9GAMM|nr:hypothetical protein HORIV_12620 [Halomonas olivaria]
MAIGNAGDVKSYTALCVTHYNNVNCFLVLPMIFLNAGSIESVIAVFSVAASTTALIFSKIKSKSTTAWLVSDIEDEIVEFTNTIGVAGAGTLLVIFLLA